ncbi:MAG: serine hydrolase domain-containing protein [Gammaproteobacteria bacterium]|nr:serine hydrolase domain-containing protein [Gammaproteobacteria bacterium]
MIKKSIKYVYISFLMAITCSAHALTRNQNIQNVLQSDLAKYHIPGIVVSIFSPGQAIQTFTAGMSDLQAGTHMRANDWFPIGSVTKSFPAVRILQLQEQGKLSLNQTLKQLAKPGSELATTINTYPYLQSITLQELLTHNSGIGDTENADIFHIEFAANPTKIWTEAELMRNAMSQKPLFKPGTPNKYNYTNTDYLLAGMVISSVTGESVSQNMQLLFNQAGLHPIYYAHTGTLIPKAVSNKLAQGYIASNSGWPDMDIYAHYPKVKLQGPTQSYAYNITDLSSYMIPLSAPAGGIITTTSNMVLWYKALFIDKKLIPAPELKELITGIPTGYGYDYGLGVTVRQAPQFGGLVISHNGSELGYQTNLIYVPHYNIIVAIATNSDNDATGDFDHGIPNDLLTILLEKPANH